MPGLNVPQVSLVGAILAPAGAALAQPGQGLVEGQLRHVVVIPPPWPPASLWFGRRRLSPVWAAGVVFGTVRRGGSAAAAPPDFAATGPGWPRMTATGGPPGTRCIAGPNELMPVRRFPIISRTAAPGAPPVQPLG